jgi:hypothetical protein
MQALENRNKVLARMQAVNKAVLRTYALQKDQFFVNDANLTAIVRATIGNTGMLTSPLDPQGTVSFVVNPNLFPRALPEGKQKRAELVVLFEGKPGALKYRYLGKALVAFADGSVRFLLPKEAEQITWRP